MPFVLYERLSCIRAVDVEGERAGVAVDHRRKVIPLVGDQLTDGSVEVGLAGPTHAVAGGGNQEQLALLAQPDAGAYRVHHSYACRSSRGLPPSKPGTAKSAPGWWP